MSTVYLAEQSSLQRTVALKVMSPSLTHDPSFGSRFYREAKIVGKLSHPNIVSIYDVGSHKHYNYIAMDYLPGAPLEDRLKQDGVTPEQALRVMREMASALDYAHQRGFIHRDIKPDNILFREDGSAVLCDFGIAKAIKGNIKMTNSGAVLGTPHYMSPEQAQGKDVDGRSDLYSLGVVGFEMLCGQPPFNGDDPIAVAVKHMSAPPPKLPAKHRLFQPLINKLLAKNPAARFQSGSELLTAIGELEQDMGRSNRALFTQGNTTSLHISAVASTFFRSLLAKISLSSQRMLMDEQQLKSTTVQLSDEQLEKIDAFVLENKESGSLGLSHKPVLARARRRWLYWPSALAFSVLATFIYLSEYQPQTLQQGYHQLMLLEQQLRAQPTTAVAATNAPTLNPSTKPVSAPAVKAPPEKTQVIEPPPPPRFALTIDTVPAAAKVRILNIKPAYHSAIKLQAGNYHIAVDAPDHRGEKLWLSLDDRDVTKTIRLIPNRRLLAAGTVIQDKLRDGSSGPDMVIIPIGNVIPSEGGEPLVIKKVLALSSHEVSFADFDKFIVATERTLPDDNGWGRGKRPVINIDRATAIAYSRWLSEQTGEHYRLPTAQEWEYGARGGSPGRFWWPGKSASQQANCRKGCDSPWSKLFGSSTGPSAEYSANNYGLFDTAGNVAEWLSDCAASDCSSEWVAGGSHRDSAYRIRSAARREVPAGHSDNDIGLRVILEL